MTFCMTFFVASCTASAWTFLWIQCWSKQSEGNPSSHTRSQGDAVSPFVSVVLFSGVWASGKVYSWGSFVFSPTNNIPSTPKSGISRQLRTLRSLLLAGTNFSGFLKKEHLAGINFSDLDIITIRVKTHWGRERQLSSRKYTYVCIRLPQKSFAYKRK